MAKSCTSESLGSSNLSFLLIIIFIFFAIINCAQIPVISDKSIVNISLKGYNVNDADGESLDAKYLIKANTTCNILITSVPEDVYFVMVQVHSYIKNMTLSYSSKPTRETSINGFNIGLVKINTSPILNYYLTYNSSVDNASIIITVQAYGVNAPIPGGCNMEFQVETSPFLITTSDEAITDIDFAPAAPSLPFFSNMLSDSDSLCNVKPNPVSYKMYRMYLPESKFSEDLYFTSLKSMMTMGRVLQNGKFIPKKYGISPTRYTFANYPRTGSVFVVVAEIENGSALYVPTLTIPCNSVSENSDCSVQTTTFSKLIYAAIFFLGLFSSFASQKFFKTQLFLLGFVIGAIFAFSIGMYFVDSTNAMICALVAGSVCGIAFLIVWCIRGLPLLPLISATSILGFLFASAVFYNLLDVFDVLVSDINYWSLFCALILIAPILMVSLSEKANIIACCIVGSYATIAPIDYYIGSNLRFIVLNTIRRATIPRFKYAIIDPPFQMKDIVLTAVWIILALLGITVQLITNKKKPPYPAPFNPFKKLYRRNAVTVVLISGNAPACPYNTPNERTSLLHSSA